METTNNLNLPYIMSAQAQKHVVHNEALRLLDGIVQLSVKSRSLTSPPVTRSEGDCFIVPAGASGPWEHKDTRIAMFADGAWVYLSPASGWISWIGDENGIFVFNEGNWTSISELLIARLSEIQNLKLVGINATADATNRLSVSSAASLFSHSGAGHQLKINKSDADQTATLLFQDRFSGKAEIGLAGDNHLSLKVSKDGNIWKSAMSVEPASGDTSFDYGLNVSDLRHRPQNLDALNILYIDPRNGNDHNDGKTVKQALASFSGIEGNMVPGQSLQVRLLGDLHVREKVSFRYPVAGLELGGWSGTGQRKVSRKLHVHPVQNRQMETSGFAFYCPSSVSLDHLEISLAASNDGMFLNFVKTTGYVASTNVTLKRVAGAHCKMIGDGSSFVPSRHQGLNIAATAKGYVFEGIKANANPNMDWRYPCNLNAV